MRFLIQNQHPKKIAWARSAVLTMLAKIPIKKIQGKDAVSLIFTDNKTISHLAATFKHKPGATDVLCFPADDVWDETAGEIVISLDTAKAQAKARGVKLQDEIVLLVIHALLHLQGFDDQTEKKYSAMKRKEAEFFLQVLS